MNREITLLLGPTASGKTDVAMALQDLLGGPDHARLISIDSAMVYRGMDIGTAKPTPVELEAYPHDLIDIRDPEASYTAAAFVEDADRAVQAALARGQHPILVGGTMLYAQRFLKGIADLPEGDAALRAALEAEFDAVGGAPLHRELREHDPVAAAGIEPNNRQRLLRALEVVRLTGKPLSEHWAQQGDTSLAARLGVGHLAFALLPERADLHSRIARRFERMLERGFLGEVTRLMARPELTGDHPSMRSVGYRQAWQHLAGEIDVETLIRTATTATRRLAKRQFTWLRSWPDIQGLETSESPERLAERLL